LLSQFLAIAFHAEDFTHSIHVLIKKIGTPSINLIPNTICTCSCYTAKTFAVATIPECVGFLPIKLCLVMLIADMGAQFCFHVGT
jgi:hypothetical protein